MRYLHLPLIVFSVFLLSSLAHANDSAVKKQAQTGSGIGYPSPAAALTALRAKPGVSVKEENGWIIANDPDEKALWTFTTAGHPAHPAAVKRLVIEKDGAAHIQMSVTCGAQKAACDRLVQQFKELNESISRSMTTADPAVDVKELGNRRYMLTLKKSQNIPIDVGQRELLPTAKSLCKNENVQYGKYQFETSEGVGAGTGNTKNDSFLLKQEIYCGDTPKGEDAQRVDAGKSNGKFVPTEEDKKLIEKLTYQYFSAKDAGNYRAAYSHLTTSAQEASPFDRWRMSAEQFNTLAGKPINRVIKKITWYKDPPSATPGIYAATDFGSRFENIDIHCGFIGWHKQSDGSFKVVREEQNYIDKKQQEKMDKATMANVKSKFGFGCQ